MYLVLLEEGAPEGDIECLRQHRRIREGCLQRNLWQIISCSVHFSVLSFYIYFYTFLFFFLSLFLFFSFLFFFWGGGELSYYVEFFLPEEFLHFCEGFSLLSAVRSTEAVRYAQW